MTTVGDLAEGVIALIALVLFVPILASLFGTLQGTPIQIDIGVIVDVVKVLVFVLVGLFVVGTFAQAID